LLDWGTANFLLQYTGCDHVEGFLGKGKQMSYSKPTESTEIRKTISKLGENTTVDPNLHCACGKYVCEMYGKPNLKSINKVRCAMYYEKPQSTHQLPPTQDAMMKLMGKLSCSSLEEKLGFQSFASITRWAWLERNRQKL